MHAVYDVKEGHYGPQLIQSVLDNILIEFRRPIAVLISWKLNVKQSESKLCFKSADKSFLIPLSGKQKESD